MIILAGDIGGTYSRLTLFDTNVESSNKNHLPLINVRQYLNSKFSQPADIIKHYLESSSLKPDSACFAIAAPVPPRIDKREQNIKLTNLPWKFNNTTLMQQFSLQDVVFINDYAGLPHITQSLNLMISAEDIRSLQTGNKCPETVSTEFIFGAGTGLGCVISTKNKHAVTVLSSEAGHSDLSADPQLNSLIQNLEHYKIPLCWESVLSGPGIARLYAHLSGFDLAAADKSARAITADAAQNSTGIDYRTLELFVKLAGNFCRNMALCCLPDHVYLVGNIFRIVFEIIPVDLFLKSFLDTSQHSLLLANIAITQIRDTQIGLKGAVAYSHSLCT